MKYDVVALGELLIDFTENGSSEQGNPLFEANPGGAPCNVLAMLAKLGYQTGFIGKVGKDVEPLENTRIFHFGTLSMTHEKVREATKRAIGIAEKAGAVISMDPNLRPPLWESLDLAKEQVMYGLGHCQILKISDNEIEWLTGEEDYTAGVNWIRSRYEIPLIFVTMGKNGSRAYYKDMIVEAAPLLRKNTIETTGAGDTFCGCILGYVLKHDLENLTEKQLKEMLTFANAAASKITTRKGALRVMPSVEEIRDETDIEF